jgi:hypothetical protein
MSPPGLSFEEEASPAAGSIFLAFMECTEYPEM